jgi:hypothetical protein
LAIKDPKSGYVRFFDMYQIIKAAGVEDIEKYVGTYPKISTLELDNTKEKANPNEENPKRAAGLRRT